MIQDERDGESGTAEEISLLEMTGEAGEAGGAEEIELDFGPRHPALQGLLRLKVRTGGDTILDAVPVLGHQHRGIEKRFEVHSWERNVPLAGRLDLAAGLAYVGAVEKLLGLLVPPRARFVRTLLAELHRLASHLLWLAHHAADVGTLAPSEPALRARESILGLFDGLFGTSGGPASGLLCPGGLARDLPAGWAGRCAERMEALPATIDEIEGLLTDNRHWKKRTVGLGVLPPELALDLGVTGPVLRASGVAWDLRRGLPAEAYTEVGFEVPVGANGDCYDRYRVRVEEMRQSVRIVRQCLEKLPEGPVLAQGAARGSGPSEGGAALPLAERGAEVYHGVEGPRGEIGFHLVAGGGETPSRCHLRSPSFACLQALPALCRGARIADLVTLAGSLDASLNDADR